MTNSEHKIWLDICDASSGEVIHLHHRDNAKTISIALYDNGKPYYVSDDCQAIFVAEKDDGTHILNECTVKGGNVYYDITSQTTAETGCVDCQIRLIGTENGKVITSPHFSLYVHPTVYEDGYVLTESKNEFDALTKTKKECEELISYIEESLETGAFDGEKGSNGIGISRIEQVVKADGNGGYNTVRVYLEDKTQYDFLVRNGTKGDDGISPAFSVAPLENGHSITLTDINGSNTIKLYNGADGYTPIKGTDYFTDEDKAEMVEAVLAALPSAEEASF